MDRKLLQKNHPPTQKKEEFTKKWAGVKLNKQIVNMRTEFSLTHVCPHKNAVLPAELNHFNDTEDAILKLEIDGHSVTQ